MKKVEIGEGFAEDAEGEVDQVDESVIEQEILVEEDGQGDLSPAVSFATARVSFSSFSSSSSSPSFTLSPSLTPLDRRCIGLAIEELVDFSYLPFTYLEWYGHPDPEATRAAMVEHGSGSTARLTNPAAAQVTETPEDVINTPFQRYGMKQKIVFSVSSRGYQHSNLLKLVRVKLGLEKEGFHSINTRRLMKSLMIKFSGIYSLIADKSDIFNGRLILTIKGSDINVVHIMKEIQKKGNVEMMSFEE